MFTDKHFSTPDGTIRVHLKRLHGRNGTRFRQVSLADPGRQGPADQRDPLGLRHSLWDRRWGPSGVRQDVPGLCDHQREADVEICNRVFRNGTTAARIPVGTGAARGSNPARAEQESDEKLSSEVRM